MKKVLFGIALILFALLLYWTDGSFRYWPALLAGFAGLVIAGIGAFTKDK